MTKVSFLGNFGTQNLGNECTLQAILGNLRKHLPDARVECICPDPEDAGARYGIATRQISSRSPHGPQARTWPGHNHAVIRLLRRIVIRVPRELLEWMRAFRALKDTTMLIIPGSGVLGNFGIDVFGLHYEMMKWSLLAKVRGSKVLFVSVGGGRLRHPVSRWLIKSALALADYRSYRDTFSKQYLDSIGFDTSRDFVYPDLAFSLPGLESAEPDHTGSGRVIGVGLMDYYGTEYSPEHAERLYHDYLESVTPFVTWLLEHDYTVRLLIGDVVYDKRVRQDVITRVSQRAVYEPGRLISEPVGSVDQLLSQLATTDMVVATRFHNVLLALALNKPVVSISYDEKNDSLMTELGLTEYCQSIRDIDVDKLVKQFIKLEENAAAIKSHIKHKTAEFRAALDAQYQAIFGER